MLAVPPGQVGGIQRLLVGDVTLRWLGVGGGPTGLCARTGRPTAVAALADRSPGWMVDLVPKVEQLAGLVDDEAPHPGVGEQVPGDRRQDLAQARQLGELGTGAEQALQGHDDLCLPLPGLQSPADQLVQGVEAPLRSGPVIVRVPRPGQAVQGRDHLGDPLDRSVRHQGRAAVSCREAGDVAVGPRLGAPALGDLEVQGEAGGVDELRQLMRRPARHLRQDEVKDGLHVVRVGQREAGELGADGASVLRRQGPVAHECPESRDRLHQLHLVDEVAGLAGREPERESDLVGDVPPVGRLDPLQHLGDDGLQPCGVVGDRPLVGHQDIGHPEVPGQTSRGVRSKLRHVRSLA